MRVAGGEDFARGLRGVVERFKSDLRGGSGGQAGGARRSAPGAGGAGARLAALVGQLHAIAARSRTATTAPGARIDAGAGRLGEGDRLARVGGFIGGGGGPALDYHRRTAAATEKAAQTLQTLAQRWASPDSAQPASIWS